MAEKSVQLAHLDLDLRKYIHPDLRGWLFPTAFHWTKLSRRD